MDAPPIQYARTDDGVNIAYWTLGDGPVLVHEQIPALSHLEFEWQHPSLRTWYERLAQSFTVVRFDHRGRGLSDRDLSDLSLDAHVRDLDAVIAAVGPPRFSLLGIQLMGPVVIAYAADHHETVESLVLLDSSGGRGDEFMESIATIAGGIAGVGHEFWVDAVVQGFDPRHTHEPELRTLAEHAVAVGAPPTLLAAFNAHDVRTAMARMRSRTLVLRTSGYSASTADQARMLVAGITDATHIIVSGEGVPTVTGTHDEQYSAVTNFLNMGREPIHSASSSAFRTILFTDVVSSTPLLAQLKDAKMRDVMHDHDAVLDAAVTEHGGRVVKEIGDAFMVEFAIPSAAVECAIAMQRGIQAQFADSDVPIRLRIGINAGEPVAEDGDLHGASVNIAKRLESAADTNGILVSDVVKQAVVGKDFEFADQGEVALKGFDDPVHAWSVEWA